MRPTPLGPIPPAAGARVRPVAARALLALVALLSVTVGAVAVVPSAAAEVRRQRAAVAVHDAPGCAGRATATVSGSFSAAVRGLAGPLVAVVVRNASGVVATSVAVLDRQGRGCAELPALEPGRYALSASDGRQQVRTPVRVVAEPVPTPTPAPPPTPPPAPPPPPGPTPATPTAAPPPPTTTPVPQPVPQPVPIPSSTARPPTAGPTAPASAPVQPTGTAAAVPGAGSPPPAAGATPPPPTARTALPAGSSPGGTASAYAEALPGAAGSPEEPAQGWRLAAQVAAVVLGAALIIALLVLVQTRSTGWDPDR